MVCWNEWNNFAVFFSQTTLRTLSTLKACQRCLRKISLNVFLSSQSCGVNCVTKMIVSPTQWVTLCIIYIHYVRPLCSTVYANIKYVRFNLTFNKFETFFIERLNSKYIYSHELINVLFCIFMFVYFWNI